MNISLNGLWKYFIEPLNIDGEQESWFSPNKVKSLFDSMDSIEILNTWNSISKLSRYEGVMWFFKEISIKNYDLSSLEDLFIIFEGINYYS